MGSPDVKRAILPKRGALVFADYKQVEPVLTGYFAAKLGYPDFAEQIRSGVDAYTAVARLAAGKEDITPEERQNWKKTYLSLLYGGGVPTIQAQYPGMDYKGARRIIDTFHENWPAVRALQDMVVAVHRDRGFIRTPWGRQLHMEENGEHKLLNKLIQGSAADLMKHAILNVDSALRAGDFEARMVSVIHDELILDAPVSEVDTLAAQIPYLMADPAAAVGITEVVPINADVEVSTETWADKIDYEEWRELAASPA